MNGGKLLQKISFNERQLLSDSAGGFIPDSPVIKILETFASIRQIKASRTAENLQESINATYEIKLRKRNGFNIESNYFIIWDSKSYNINSIEEDLGPKKEWTLLVSSRGTGL